LIFSVIPKKDSIRDSFEINLHNIYSNQDKIVQGFAPYMPKFLDFIDTRFSKKATPEDVIYLIKHPDIQFI